MVLLYFIKIKQKQDSYLLFIYKIVQRRRGMRPDQYIFTYSILNVKYINTYSIIYKYG